ncbi:hypothetical protein F-E9_433 [Faustovirus]|nr:hypothetical protein F-E9_433 [Faustovirus]
MQTVVFLTLIVILLLIYYYRNYTANKEKFYGQCPCGPNPNITEQGLYEGNILDPLAPGALNPFMFPYSAYPCPDSVRDAYKDEFEQTAKMKQEQAKSDADEAKKLKEMSNNSTTDHVELVD